MEASLREEEIRYILHAADSLIGSGGRSMLAKILKGSRDKKLLELELNTNVAYGYYSYLTLEQITERVDWMIKNDFLELEYQRDMPLLVFTEKGWLIQRDQMADLLLHQWNQWIEAGIGVMDMSAVGACRLSKGEESDSCQEERRRQKEGFVWNDFD